MRRVPLVSHAAGYLRGEADATLESLQLTDETSTSVSTHVGDSDLADLAEEVAVAEVIKTAAVA